MRRILTAATLIALMSASGCSGGEPAAEPVVTTAPASPAGATSAVAVPADAQGALACKLIYAATEGTDDALMQPGTVDAITTATAGSSTSSITRAGAMLADRYELAQAAQGADDEFPMEAGLLTAAIDLKTACVTAGLDPA